MSHTEHRQFHRIAHDAPATIEDQGGTQWSGRALDLSLKGCLLEPGAEPDLVVGQDYRVIIHLGADVDITMHATLIHSRQGRAGFMCQHIDLDSISALRRLVELNLGDPTLLDRDLEALAAGHD